MIHLASSNKIYLNDHQDLMGFMSWISKKYKLTSKHEGSNYSLYDGVHKKALFDQDGSILQGEDDIFDLILEWKNSN